MKALLFNYDLRYAIPTLRVVTDAIKNSQIDLFTSTQNFRYNGYDILIINATSTDNIIDSYHIQVSKNSEPIGNIKLRDGIIEYCIKEEDSGFKKLFNF